MHINTHIYTYSMYEFKYKMFKYNLKQNLRQEL